MLELALTHWPFLAVTFALGVTGAVMKALFLPPDKIVRGWRSLYQATLPLHAAVVGCLIGLIPSMPIVAEFHPAWLYYMLAGLVSSYAYDAGRHFIQSKTRMSLPPTTYRGEAVPDDGQP